MSGQRLEQRRYLTSEVRQPRNLRQLRRLRKVQQFAKIRALGQVRDVRQVRDFGQRGERWCAERAIEGILHITGVSFLGAIGIGGDAEARADGRRGVDTPAVIGPTPLRANHTRQCGGAVVLAVAIRRHRGRGAHSDQHRVDRVFALLGLQELHGVSTRSRGIAPVTCTMGVAEAVCTRGGVDGIRVATVELACDVVVRVTNHLRGLRFIGLRAVLEDVVRDVELHNRQPRARFMLVGRTVVHTGRGVSKADLGTPRSIDGALRGELRLRSGSGVSSRQRKTRDSDDAGQPQANCAGRSWSNTMTSVHIKHTNSQAGSNSLIIGAPRRV